MSDLKLYRLEGAAVTELSSGSMALERSLQTLFEQNLESLLGVRFLASEFATNEGGRMDTLGIDENNSPVVIEYKRSSNENVINQGLYYLEWLVGHRKDFEWLVLEKFGEAAAKSVDWSGPRLICIASDFGKYDDKAVKIMNRNIALIRYRKFEGDLLLLEQLTAVSAKPAPFQPSAGSPTSPAIRGRYRSVSDQVSQATKELSDLFHLVSDYLIALGDDVQSKTNENYVAFRRLKNFACLELRNQSKKLLVYVKVNPDTLSLESGFTRDVRGIGHFGTGDLEITIQSAADLEKAKPLFDRSYEGS